MTTGDPSFCKHCGEPTGLSGPYQVCRKCIGVSPPVFQTVAPGYHVTEPKFAGKIPSDIDSPPIICPSCRRPATWAHAEDGHAESCYQCGSCGEHYSRQREAIYIPVGMTRETAKALLGESPFRGFLQESTAGVVKEDVAKPLCPICGEYSCIHTRNNKQFECRSPACGNRHDDVDDILCRECRPTDECGQAGLQFVEVDSHDEACLLLSLDYKKGHLFLSKEMWESIREHAWPSLVSDLSRDERILYEENTELRRQNDNLRVEKEIYYTRAREAETNRAELQQKIEDLQGGQWDDERTIQSLRDDLKKGSEQLNEALELLWAFVDAISDKPRLGNVFVRAKEVLEKIGEWRNRSNWLIKLSNMMYKKPDAPGNVIFEQVDELMREAAQYQEKARWFDQVWETLGFPNTIEEFGKNFGRAANGLVQEYMHNAERRFALITKIHDYFGLNIKDDDEKIVDFALVQYENYKDSLRAAKDNHRLDALDIITAIEDELPGMTDERFTWVMAKLRDISNGKGRGGIQS